MTPIVDMLGWTCVVVSNTIMLPQLYRIVKNKHARDVSLGMLILGTISQLLWGTYGWMKQDSALWQSSVIALMVGSIVLYSYWYYERRKQ